MRRRIAALWVLAALLCQCAPNPEPDSVEDLFAEAEQLCLEGDFEGAKTRFKEYLLHDPENAGAHYYLGRTYMLSEDFRPMLAEGEYQTAVRLFIRQGRISPIERFRHDYFEMICHVDSAKVLYLQVSMMLALDVPRNALREPLTRALRYLDKARAIMPDAPEIRQVGEPLSALAYHLGIATASSTSGALA